MFDSIIRIGFFSIFVFKNYKSKNLVLGRQRRDNEDVRTNLLDQIFSGFSEIKLRNSENFFRKIFIYSEQNNNT